MSSWRHLSRVIVMQSFFEHLIRGNDVKGILDYNLKEYGDKIDDPSFAESLLLKMKKHQKAIDKLIHKHAPEWPLAKMDPVERVILTLGICELLHPEKDVPVNVAINEAIELAKTFGDENSSKFVNGVLNAVAHDKTLKIKLK
jgi:transcription antitermination protein NusB